MIYYADREIIYEKELGSPKIHKLGEDGPSITIVEANVDLKERGITQYMFLVRSEQQLSESDLNKVVELCDGKDFLLEIPGQKMFIAAIPLTDPACALFNKHINSISKFLLEENDIQYNTLTALHKRVMNSDRPGVATLYVSSNERINGRRGEELKDEIRRRFGLETTFTFSPGEASRW